MLSRLSWSPPSTYSRTMVAMECNDSDRLPWSAMAVVPGDNEGLNFKGLDDDAAACLVCQAVVCIVAHLFHPTVKIGDELYAADESVSRDLRFCVVVDRDVLGRTVAFAVQQWSLIRHASCSAFIACTTFCWRTWLPVFSKAWFSRASSSRP